MLLVHTIVLLTYPKGYVLFLRSTCIKYIVVTSFLLESSTIFSCNIVTVTGL